MHPFVWIMSCAISFARLWLFAHIGFCWQPTPPICASGTRQLTSDSTHDWQPLKPGMYIYHLRPRRFFCWFAFCGLWIITFALCFMLSAVCWNAHICFCRKSPSPIMPTTSGPLCHYVRHLPPSWNLECTSIIMIVVIVVIIISILPLH